ncbi:hypothetical protein BO99DRAFT_224449 [Aspergillus violaceofuscus CBS 115571]|uniref:Uncharacterized protein n=1 Tax=Aspergillus violaceofuscus (strain CBS 115571) TaxID=1450538 RepID=A0A2V5HH92_ASPV1|nr:hypothetical protein BO99DRAFT_224449 [Aspergillus violaceofuscus CBS 115571]
MYSPLAGMCSLHSYTPLPGTRRRPLTETAAGLAIRCTYTRLPKKRGRKSTRSRPSPALVQHPPDYPVLDCLNGLSILSPEKEKTESTTLPPTRYEASRLLEHSYESPNQEFHTRLIRKSRLLDLESPRPTLPTLLLSILCMHPRVSCSNQSGPPSDMSQVFPVSCRRRRSAQARHEGWHKADTFSSS